MTETSSPEPKHKDWRARVQDAWQTIFVLFSAFIMLVSMPNLRKLDAPGAPVVLFWITAAVGVLVLIAHWPSIFERLSSRWRGASYVAWVGFFFLMITALTKVDAAWERTPQGAAEAKQEAAQREASDAEWDRTQRIEAQDEVRRQRDGAALKEA